MLLAESIELGNVSSGDYRLKKRSSNSRQKKGSQRLQDLYQVRLEGEIWLLTDTDEILLKAGDTVVCRGANHHWQNRAAVPCTSIFVIIDAQPQEITSLFPKTS